MEEESNETKSTAARSSFKDENGFTDLHIAAWTGNIKKLSALLKTDLDVNVQDNEMRTPLHLAAAQGHQEVVEALVKADADMNMKDKGENTPLLKALEVGNKAVAKYLIEKGADLSLTDSDNNSALHIAIQKGYRKLTSHILKRTDNTNATNNNDQTPLHLASCYGRTDCTKQLLQHGANINCSDNKGRTPLMLACSIGHYKIADILLQAGAEPYVLDKDGLTAKTIAEDKGHQDIANLIVSHSIKNEEILPDKESKMSYSFRFQDKPERLLTAESEKTGKTKTGRRIDYVNSGGEGINEGTVKKVSIIMDDMRGTTSKLSDLRTELQQRQSAADRNKQQIESLKAELEKAIAERNGLLGSGKNATESIKTVKDELKLIHENVCKLQTENGKLQQKLINEEAINAELKRHLDRTKDHEQELRRATEKLERHIGEMETDQQNLTNENNKMDGVINQLKADLQNKENERSDWSGKMAAANTQKSNLLLQVEILEKDKNSKQMALDECIRNYELKVQTIAGERDALEKRLNAEAWRRTIAEKKILALQQEVTNVTDDCNSTRKEASDLQTKLEEQSRSHSNAEKILREQVDILKEDNVSLSERVNDLKISLQQLESELEKEHIESDTIICSLHKELNKTNALLRDKSRDMGDNFNI